jgi:TrmH family RNA methyltransferase
VPLLNNVTVVLVEPATLANIGATARVLKNTGIPHLALVRPPDPWDTDETRWIAHASGEILDSCQVYADLAAAVANAHLVIGTTHRTGRFREVEEDPRAALAEVAPLAAHHRISLVFGRERDGLWRDELLVCHRLLRFPTAVAYPSLNLSHAVLLLAYELFAAVQVSRPTPRLPLLTAGERDKLLEHLFVALQTIGFRPYNDDPDNVSRVVRRFLNKIPLDGRDARVLHLLCGQVDKFAATHRGVTPTEAGQANHTRAGDGN